MTILSVISSSISIFNNAASIAFFLLNTHYTLTLAYKLSPYSHKLLFSFISFWKNCCFNSGYFSKLCNVISVKGLTTKNINPSFKGSMKCRFRFSVRASEKTVELPKKFVMTDAECEAAVVAGSVLHAPPVPPKPKAPIGTPLIAPLNLPRRPRRNRRSAVLREAFQETTLSPANMVYPLFIHEGEEDVPIPAMPGCYRLGWRHGLIEEVAKARDVGVNSVLLFPKVPDALKSPTGVEAYNEDGLIPRSIRILKDKFLDLVIYTDGSLDPYSSGGSVREDGIIFNDEIVYQLCKQAIAHARAGADVVSPSSMMDGRIGAIRQALDTEGFEHVSIMSYTAKYASALYGPFKEALDSNPVKRTCQMNPANYREALLELHEDESEGADILMVKPGLPYLDIVRLLRDNSSLPIAAYQVSGEYSMIKAGAALKMIDEERVMMESLMCLRRAGADIILTYFSIQAARFLCGEKYRIDLS